MERDLSNSIWDIANWERDGVIDIPALQRGLVWTPHQVELLWDSILRGFPIGAFALTPVCGNEKQIANGTNQVMLGGGGVDGAIHRAAGRELYEACLKVPEVRPGVRCPTGEARITPGFKLPAKFIIHTVGPVYRDGQHGEPEKLANCYRNSLALAAENGCKSIAFPCISTGVYGYPIEDAAKIAVREVRDFLTRIPQPKAVREADALAEVRRRDTECEEEMEVIFCCFSERDMAVYNSLVR